MLFDKARPFLYPFLVVACLSLLLWTKATVTSAAAEVKNGKATVDAPATTAMPKQCRVGKTSTENLGWRWKPSTRVRIYYLKNNFIREETEAFSRAVNNWNSALREIDSRIVFTINGERESVSEDNASITVMRGVPKGKDRLG